MIGSIDSLVFENCDAVGGALDADVTTTGRHTLAASGEHTNSAGESAMAISVPPAGSVIDFGPGLCTNTFSPGMASAVFGSFLNDTDQPNPDGVSELSVKGQIETDQGCGDVNPSVLIANGEAGTTPYEVVNTDNPNDPIEILPLP